MSRLKGATVILGRPGLPGKNGTNGTNGTNGGVTDHTLLTNIGTRTHLQLESDIALKLDKAWSVGAYLTTDLNTTLTAVTILADLIFAVPANSRWIVEYHLFTGCNGTGGIKVQAGIPTGASISSTAFGTTTSAGAFTSIGMDTALTPAFNTGAFFNGWLDIRGMLIVGSTAGNATMALAATTAGQQATAYTRSYVTAQRIP